MDKLKTARYILKLLALASLLSAVLSQLMFNSHRTLPSTFVQFLGHPGQWLLILSLLLVWAYSWFNRIVNLMEDTRPTFRLDSPYRLANQPLKVWALFFIPLLISIYNLSNVPWLNMGGTGRFREAFICWSLSLVLLRLLAGWLDLNSPSTPPAESFRWWELLFLASVIGIAVFLRFYRITTIPPGLYHDEAAHTYWATGLLDRSSPINFFSFGDNGYSMADFVMSAVSLLLFSDPITGTRAAGIILSIMAFPPTYFLWRHLFNRRVAMITVFLLSASSWFLMFSRSIACDVNCVFLIPIAIYYAWRAFEDGRNTDFFWTGISLGFCFYYYLAARFFFIWIIVVIFYFLLTDRTYLRRNLGGLFVLGVSFAVCTLPLLYSLSKQPGANYRFASLSITNNYPFWQWPLISFQNFWRQMLIFNFWPGSGETKTLIVWERGMLVDMISGVFFILGFSWFLYHWRNRRSFFILTGFGICLLPALAANPALGGIPTSHRILALLPLAYGIIGFAMNHWISHFKSHLIQLILIIIACAWVLTANTTAFFHKHANMIEWQLDSGVHYTQASLETRRASLEDWNTVISPSYCGGYAFRLINRGLENRSELLNGLTDLWTANIGRSGTAFLISHELSPLSETLQKAYSSGQQTEFLYPVNRLNFITYRIPAPELMKHRGLEARYDLPNRFITRTELSPEPGSVPDLKNQRTFRARWTGQLVLPRLAEYRFLAKQSVGASWKMRLDGVSIDLSGVKEHLLGPGPHTVELTAVFTQGPGDFALTFRLDGGISEPVQPVQWVRLGKVPSPWKIRVFKDDGFKQTLYTASLPVPWVTEEYVRGRSGIELTGTWEIREQSTIHLRLVSSGPASLTVDGRHVTGNLSAPDQPIPEITLSLDRGPHVLRIRSIQNTGKASLMLLQGESPPCVIPPSQMSR